MAISSLLPTIYDIILNNRFSCWYKINPEQAGFRKQQGCVIQILAIYLLIELANSQNETVFIGFVDYEKAFDFTNRAEIVRDIVENNTGATFTKAVSQMYSRNYNAHRLGEPISAEHGVTQGRKSSTTLFSFAISCIPKAIFINTDLLSQNNHVLQLADDASIISNSCNDLAVAFKQLIEVSESKYMMINVEKTFYIHASKNPIHTTLRISEKQLIPPALNNQHLYLRMWILASDNIADHIKYNLNHRKYNIKKYYDWLNINQDTPIKIKLQV